VVCEKKGKRSDIGKTPTPHPPLLQRMSSCVPDPFDRKQRCRFRQHKLKRPKKQRGGERRGQEDGAAKESASPGKFRTRCHRVKGRYKLARTCTSSKTGHWEPYRDAKGNRRGEKNITLAEGQKKARRRCNVLRTSHELGRRRTIKRPTRSGKERLVIKARGRTVHQGLHSHEHLNTGTGGQT